MKECSYARIAADFRVPSRELAQNGPDLGSPVCKVSGKLLKS